MLAIGVTGCVTGASDGGGGSYVEAFNPTADALAGAFGKPTREDDAQAVLAAQVSTPAFLEQYPATRQKAGCPDRGACTHRLTLVRVNGQGRPVGDPPSCGQISAQLDREASGQVSVRGVTWLRRSGPCA